MISCKALFVVRAPVFSFKKFGFSVWTFEPTSETSAEPRPITYEYFYVCLQSFRHVVLLLTACEFVFITGHEENFRQIKHVMKFNLFRLRYYKDVFGQLGSEWISANLCLQVFLPVHMQSLFLVKCLERKFGCLMLILSNVELLHPNTFSDTSDFTAVVWILTQKTENTEICLRF